MSRLLLVPVGNLNFLRKITYNKGRCIRDQKTPLGVGTYFSPHLSFPHPPSGAPESRLKFPSSFACPLPPPNSSLGREAKDGSCCCCLHRTFRKKRERVFLFMRCRWGENEGWRQRRHTRQRRFFSTLQTCATVPRPETS